MPLVPLFVPNPPLQLHIQNLGYQMLGTLNFADIESWKFAEKDSWKFADIIFNQRWNFADTFFHRDGNLPTKKTFNKNAAKAKGST